MKSNVDMCRGPILRGIIRYTIPIILTNFLHLAFNAADLIVVGRFCGSLSVAAVGATGALTATFVNLFNGMSIGTGVCVAQSAGAGSKRQLHRAVHTTVPLALLLGISMTAIALCFAPGILRVMGTPEDILPLSTTYVRIFFFGITLDLLYNYSAAVLRAIGESRKPLIFLTSAGVLNVALNLLFVIGFKMDVAGVALATTLSKLLSAALVLASLMRRTDACKLRLREMHIYKAQLFKILHIGIPAGIQASLFGIANITVQSSVNSLGSVVVSGNAAAANIGNFICTGMNSVSTAAMNFIGQNVGAQNPRRVRQIYHTCLALVTVVGMAMSALLWIFARPLLGIYITDSPQAIDYGVLRVTVVGLSYFLCGMVDVSSSSIRGMGVSVITMFNSLLGACGLRILWILTVFSLPQFHTPVGLYLCYPVSWAITFLAHAITYRIVFHRWVDRIHGAREKEAVPAKV